MLRMLRSAYAVCCVCRCGIDDVMGAIDCPAAHTRQLMACSRACYEAHLGAAHPGNTLSVEQRIEVGSFPLAHAPSIDARQCRACSAVTHFMPSHAKHCAGADAPELSPLPVSPTPMATAAATRRTRSPSARRLPWKLRE